MTAASVPDDSAPDAVGRGQLPAVVVPAPEAGAMALARIGLGLLGLIAVVALVMAIVLWQKVGGMQEQLARQGAGFLFRDFGEDSHQKPNTFQTRRPPALERPSRVFSEGRLMSAGCTS